MTIPYLIGTEMVGRDLGEITKVIGNLINPNAEYQHALKLAFTQNPELMQKFVDIEKANPGTLKAFGFGDAGSDILTRMQESIPALRNRMLQPEVAAELGKKDSESVRAATSQAVSGQTPGQLAEDNFAEWQAKTGMRMAQDNPQLYEAYVRSRWGVGALQDQRTQQEVSNIMSADQLLGKGVPDLVNGINNGSITSEVIGAGMLDPRVAPALRLAVAQAAQERTNQLDMNLARARIDGNDPLARTRLSAAIDAWNRSGKVGSLGGWYAQMWNSDDFGAPTEEDKRVIPQALKDATMLAGMKRSQEVYRAIQPTVDKLRGKGSSLLTPEEVAPDIDRINVTLRELGSGWRAQWYDGTDKGWLWWDKPSKLLFVDENGNATPDPTAIISTAPTTNTIPIQQLFQQDLTPEEEAIAQNIANTPRDQREAMYAAIRATNPTSEQRIRAVNGD